VDSGQTIFVQVMEFLREFFPLDREYLDFVRLQLLTQGCAILITRGKQTTEF
jgi:hypothetical protein